VGENTIAAEGDWDPNENAGLRLQRKPEGGVTEKTQRTKKERKSTMGATV